VTHSSFAAWVEAEVLPKNGSQERLDGRKSGGNRAVFGRFKHQGRAWVVHGDTRIERVRRAYEAMQTGEFPDPLILERAKVRDCLNLVKAIRKPKEPKHFYVYSIGR
jgi:hypothetical protein